MNIPAVGDEITIPNKGIGVIAAIEGNDARIVLNSGEEIVASLAELMNDDDAQPYFTFDCEECGKEVQLLERLEPGQAAVLECDNCGESWTVVLPSLELYRTSKFEAIWPLTQFGGAETNNDHPT